VEKFFSNNLDHIPLYVERGLHFHAFNRFYDAYREFLQAAFISWRIYPLSYEKWIRKQVYELLCEPDLYSRLVDLFEISDFDGGDILGKGTGLRTLWKKFLKK
jgi:hypothetical protein